MINNSVSSCALIVRKLVVNKIDCIAVACACVVSANSSNVWQMGAVKNVSG